MKFTLKKIRKEAIPTALERAVRYRLLNEPQLAESICIDVLEVEPKNQQALVTLILALIDQFQQDGYAVGKNRPEKVLERFEDQYSRHYYAGLILERRAKASIHKRIPGFVAYQWLRKAMENYEKAEALASDDNDDARLRWNTCARIIMENSSLEPEESDLIEHRLE